MDVNFFYGKLSVSRTCIALYIMCVFAYINHEIRVVFFIVAACAKKK